MSGLTFEESSICVKCHADLKGHGIKSKLPDIKDFDQGHPAFRLALREGPQGRKVTLIQPHPGEVPTEKSGLKYSHMVHLDKEGVSTPDGGIVMICQDCHIDDGSGVHFQPMDMKKTCQQAGCHSLDHTEPLVGMAPHGSEKMVMDELRTFYLHWLTEHPEPNCTQKGLADCADARAREHAASTLFRDDVECGECHEIQSTDDPTMPFKVAPVYFNRNWQPGAEFSHARHSTMQCTDCHDKTNSEASEDIAMPSAKKCRECHAGENAPGDRIHSPCGMCHRFHRAPTKRENY